MKTLSKIGFALAIASVVIGALSIARTHHNRRIARCIHRLQGEAAPVANGRQWCTDNLAAEYVPQHLTEHQWACQQLNNVPEECRNASR